jgi:hypothetical protein
MAKQIKINVPLNQLKTETCVCTNTLWIPALQLRILPPIYSASGKYEYAMIQVGFLCSACGVQIPMRPEDLNGGSVKLHFLERRTDASQNNRT